MALVKTDNIISDIRGGLGGIYFSRDRFGLHCCAKPRVIQRRTPGQDAQRKAFSAARSFSQINRTVSYLMYRHLTGLPITLPVGWSSPSSHFDPGTNKWASPQNCYDDDDDTFSNNACADSGHFLELINSEIITCPKVRVMARQKNNCVGGGTIEDPNITVDIYSSGVWQNIHTGLITLDTFVELPCPVPLLTNRMRIKDNTPTARFRLYEVDFWAIPYPPHYPVPQFYEIPHWP